jgi:hypothetical protein
MAHCDWLTRELHEQHVRSDPAKRLHIHKEILAVADAVELTAQNDRLPEATREGIKRTVADMLQSADLDTLTIVAVRAT